MSTLSEDYLLRLDKKFSDAIFFSGTMRLEESPELHYELHLVNLRHGTLLESHGGMVHNRLPLRKNGIQYVCIPTKNRPHILKDSVKAYQDSLNYFEHTNVEIIIFDFSDEDIASQNQDVLHGLNRTDITVTYVGREEQSAFFSSLGRQGFSCEQIESTFPQTVGGNRNLVFAYGKGMKFITLDDDSFPSVLTCPFDEWEVESSNSPKDFMERGNFHFNSDLVKRLSLEDRLCLLRKRVFTKNPLEVPVDFYALHNNLLGSSSAEFDLPKGYYEHLEGSLLSGELRSPGIIRTTTAHVSGDWDAPSLFFLEQGVANGAPDDFSQWFNVQKEIISYCRPGLYSEGTSRTTTGFGIDATSWVPMTLPTSFRYDDLMINHLCHQFDGTSIFAMVAGGQQHKRGWGNRSPFDLFTNECVKDVLRTVLLEGSAKSAGASGDLYYGAMAEYYHELAGDICQLEEYYSNFMNLIGRVTGNPDLMGISAIRAHFEGIPFEREFFVGILKEEFTRYSLHFLNWNALIDAIDPHALPKRKIL